MEERGNKTIMCSVLFLDIVEYSKKSVAGQISLRDRFNSHLSAAIRDVPMSDRIILDTGDGAAINFLGDVEDALKAALSLRESILNEDPSLDPPLLVRAGVNLGPVRLVRDINGQPNIVGDGINVAQRVMGFAEAGQILVSRSYYDAVSRLSPQYAGMFSYQGSRTDKHVREHEVYAIGYPGDKTTQPMTAGNVLAGHEASSSARILARVKVAWNSAASRLDSVIESVVARFGQAEPRQRALYAAAVGIPLLLLIALTVKLAHRNEVPVSPITVDMQATSAVQPASAVAAASRAEGKAADASTLKPAVTSKPGTKKTAERKTDSKKVSEHPDARPKTSGTEPTGKKTWFETIKGGVEQGTEAYISISCKEGTQLFVDGAQKGKIISVPLTVAVAPGKHTVIVSHASGDIYTQNVVLDPGKTVRIKPNFCD